MKQYSEDLKFKAIDSTIGNNQIDSTLALVNDSSLQDEEVRKKVSGFLEKITIDFHSDNLDVPRELPAIYEDGEHGINYCSIYAPRDGKIKSVYANPSAIETKYTGKNGQWETFATRDADYAVMVG